LSARSCRSFAKQDLSILPAQDFAGLKRVPLGNDRLPRDHVPNLIAPNLMTRDGGSKTWVKSRAWSPNDPISKYHSS
jgi:hypothetical protein